MTAEIGLLAVVWTFSAKLWVELVNISDNIQSIGITPEGQPFALHSPPELIRGTSYERTDYAHKDESGAWTVGRSIDEAELTDEVDWITNMGTDIGNQTHILTIDPTTGKLKELTLPS